MEHMDLTPYVGRLIPHTYNAGFIVLSYVVSATGSWTALELLHRRTSVRGLYNWYLLLGAATAMGAVAIWSMHFIGNRAITMSGGEAALQIAYSPGYTAGSFFLPICVVGLAFFLFTISDVVTIIGTLSSGFLTGLAVCGMHYMGQGGISNYQPTYDIKNVVGAAVIAVVAATTALGLFFYSKSAWTDTWWKRFLCALLLAVAVSGMHWVATVGTNYRLKGNAEALEGGLSRQATVIIVLCLALGCCVTLMIFATIGQRSRQRSANRAQQVVLACATWDPDGRLMVTPEGLLPCRKITNSYIERSFDDVFSIEHPVFCWIFRASRCWKGVVDLIPGMRSHLRSTVWVKNTSRPGSGSTTDHKRDNSLDGCEDYSQAFKELFCVAALDLAAAVQEPLESLGVLYDEIINTGTTRKSKRATLFTHGRNNRTEDVERAVRMPTILGRGQLLFVVRHTNKSESAQLQAAGFRFAAVPHVIDNLSRSIQVNVDQLRPCLDKMRHFNTTPAILEPGVHLACFALRPLFQRGFDILVCKGATNLLPTMSLPIPELKRWHTDFISRMDDWTVSACLEFLEKARSHTTAEELHFVINLADGIRALKDQIDHPFFLDARLTARPLRAPCRNPNGSAPPGQAMIIAFRVIADVHHARLLNGRVEFIPSKFFQAQQHVYKSSPDHETFARRIHREFSPFSERKGSNTSNSKNPRNSTGPLGGRGFRPDILRTFSSSPVMDRSKWKWPSSRDLSAPNCQDNNDTSSEKSLVDTQNNHNNVFGGIHVSNEVSIDVSEIRGTGDTSPDVEMMNLGVYSEAGVAPMEKETFVDELLALTIGERRREKI